MSIDDRPSKKVRFNEIVNINYNTVDLYKFNDTNIEINKCMYTCNCENYIFCVQSKNILKNCKNYHKIQMFYPQINAFIDEYKSNNLYIVLFESINNDNILGMNFENNSFNNEYADNVNNTLLIFFRIYKYLDESDQLLSNILLFNFIIIHFAYIKSTIPNITKVFYKKLIEIREDNEELSKYKYILTLYNCNINIIDIWIEQFSQYV